VKGKGLDLAAYPFVESSAYRGKHRKIFVYVIGGTTYAESFAVHTLNQHLKENGLGVRIFLGGSFVHNSRTFISDLLGLESIGDAKSSVIIPPPSSVPSGPVPSLLPKERVVGRVERGPRSKDGGDRELARLS